MRKQPPKEQPSPSIETLYPHLTDAQRQEAEENIDRYLQLALCIYERIREDPQLYAQLQNLTTRKHDPTMHGTLSAESPKPKKP